MKINQLLLGIGIGIVLSLIVSVVATVITIKEYTADKITVHDTVEINCTDTVDVRVRLTYYQPTIEQCDSTPTCTADGSWMTNKSFFSWCAVSRDLMFGYVNFGDTIVIQKDSLIRKFVVHDNMGSGGRSCVDILIPTNEELETSLILREKMKQLNAFANAKGDQKIIKIIRR